MTQEFASIELARIYEAQGYLEDALEMYRKLEDDVLTGGAEIRAAVRRIELALESAVSEEPYPSEDDSVLYRDLQSAPAAFIANTLEVLNGEPDPDLVTAAPLSADPPPLVGEGKIARLMEKWLMLMVVRKRVQLFKKIRSRL